MNTCSVSAFARNAWRRSGLSGLLGLAVLTAAATVTPARSSETVLYRFKGDADGASPYAGLVLDEKGALYGTTIDGGTNDGGTVFKLTPPSSPAIKWIKSTLYRFKGVRDGFSPGAGLILDSSGALYGTTTFGGQANVGTVFKLSPPEPSTTKWTKAVLYSFKGTGDGFFPKAGLILDKSGALYGTTAGPDTSTGTVFKLTPPTSPATGWTETVLYRFKGGIDGNRSAGSLILDGSGALYGTTGDGGTDDNGTVFKLTPSTPPGTKWTKSTLYRFRGNSDGSYPQGSLTLDGGGALYGTTAYGGIDQQGTVFKLTPPAPPRTRWTETILYRFRGLPDGANPSAGLVLDGNGIFYGTTTYGGLYGAGQGTVFKLSPPTPPATEWTETVLHRFELNPDGARPQAGLVLGGNDSLFGTTAYGGNNDCSCGTVFRIK